MSTQLAKIKRTLVVGYAVSILIGIALGYTAYIVSRDEIVSADWVAHTEGVVGSLEAIRSSALDAESMGRKYLEGGHREDFERYHRLVLIPYQRLREFKQLTSDNVRQQDRAEELKGFLGRRFTELSSRTYRRRDEGVLAMQRAMGKDTWGQGEMDSIKKVINEAIFEEKQLLAVRNDVRDTNIHLIWTTLAAAGLLGFGLLSWAFLRIFAELRLRGAAEDSANHLAHHDGLTGLPNRRMLQDRLSQGMADAERHKHKVALLFLDLDGFKMVNDKHGHDVGDELLKEVGKRLILSIRKNDTAVRLGGDEFVIALLHIERESEVEVVAKKLVAVVSRPYQIDHISIAASTSVGISIFPNDATTDEALMKNADLALYTAKKLGKNRYCWFSETLTNA